MDYQELWATKFSQRLFVIGLLIVGPLILFWSCSGRANTMPLMWKCARHLQNDIYPMITSFERGRESILVRENMMFVGSEDLSILACPACPEYNDEIGYLFAAYVPRTEINRKGTSTVLACDRVGNHPNDWVLLLYADGSVYRSPRSESFWQWYSDFETGKRCEFAEGRTGLKLR